MSNKEVQIILSAKDMMSKTFKTAGNNINWFSRTAKTQLSQVTTSISKIASSARALTLPMSAMFGTMVASGNSFVKTAHEANMGGILFSNMLKRVGEDIEDVNPRLQALAKEIKTPAVAIQQSAAELLRNGYTWKQIEGIYKGAAASGLLVGKSTADSVRKVTEALVTQLSIHLNQIGIVQNLSTAYTQYAKKIGKTKDTLTETEKAEASYLMVMKATAQEIQDMPTLFMGYGGAISDFNNQLFKSKVLIGNELLPIWTDWLTKGTNLLENFLNLNEEQKDLIFNVGKVAALAIGAAAGIGLIASAGYIASKAIGLLSGIFSLATSKVGLGAILLAGVGYLVYNAWNSDWLGMKSKITEWADAAVEKFNLVKNWWDNSQLKESLTSAWDELKAIWTSDELTLPDKYFKTLELTFDTIEVIAVEAWKFLEKNTMPFLQMTIDKISVIGVKAWDFGIDFGTRLFDTLTERVKKYRTALGPIKDAVREWSEKGFTNFSIDAIDINLEENKFFLDIMELAKSAGEFFKEVFLITVDMYTILGDAISGVLVRLVDKLLDLGAGIGAGILDGIKSIFDWENLGQILKSALPKWLVDGVTGGINTAKNVWTSFKNWLGGLYEGAIIPGKSGPDQFLAMLAPGEAVVPAKAVNAGWPAVLSWFKEQGVPGFQSGFAPTGNAALDAQLTQTSGWLDGISDMISQTTNVVIEFFTWLGGALIGILEKFFPEQAGEIQKFFDEAKGILEKLFAPPKEPETPQKKAEETVTPVVLTMWEKIFADAKDLITLAGKGLGEQMLAKAPIANKVMQGVQSGAPGGPMGMIAGGLVAAIAESQTFADLMSFINPILKTAADTIGLLIEPILPVVDLLGTILTPAFEILGGILQSLLIPLMKPLFEGFKLVGIVINIVAAGFYTLMGVFNWFASGIMKVLHWIFVILPGFKSLERSTKKLADQFSQKSKEDFEKAGDSIKKAGEIAKMKFEDFGKTVDEVNSAMRNVPQGIKIALNRFNAAQGILPPGGIFTPPPTKPKIGLTSNTTAATSNTMPPLTVKIEGSVYGVDDLKGTIKEALNEYERKKRLSATGLVGGVR